MAGERAVLVTGGAGYVGSHIVLALLDAGRRAVVIDDLSTGRRALVPAGVPFIEGDVGDTELVSAGLAEHDVDAVIHCAGAVVVPESIEDPLKYYQRNVAASARLLRACVDRSVGRFIFSSTAAVYGAPDGQPIAEDSPLVPINPYGRSKLMFEWMLRDCAAAYGLRYVALRYFNVAGADPNGRSGQCSPVATHLIKVAGEAFTGKRDHVAIFGDDYPTPDGTCIRDYIHIADLSEAHLAVLRRLEDGGESRIYNCGYGAGYSVREVLDSVQAVVGQPIDVRTAPRRAGDPPELVADSRKLRDELGWTPAHDDLNGIIASAIAWERRLREED